MRRQKIEEFCEFHQMTMYHLAQLAEVTHDAVLLYRDGSLKPGKRLRRIEVAMEVIRANGIIFEPTETNNTWANNANKLRDVFVKRHIRRILLLD